MPNEDLIKSYKTEKFNIERDISREEDALLKYQLKRDDDAVIACRERLANLYSNLKRIVDKIHELENGINDSFDAPIPLRPSVPDITKDIPIDDGTASVKITVSNVTRGSEGSGSNRTNIHEVYTHSIEKTLEVKDGEVISETKTEHTSKRTDKRKDDNIEINAKLIN